MQKRNGLSELLRLELDQQVTLRSNDRITTRTEGTDPESTKPTKEDWKARAALSRRDAELALLNKCKATTVSMGQ